VEGVRELLLREEAELDEETLTETLAFSEKEGEPEEEPSPLPEERAEPEKGAELLAWGEAVATEAEGETETMPLLVELLHTVCRAVSEALTEAELVGDIERDPRALTEAEELREGPRDALGLREGDKELDAEGEAPPELDTEAVTVMLRVGDRLCVAEREEDWLCLPVKESVGLPVDPEDAEKEEDTEKEAEGEACEEALTVEGKLVVGVDWPEELKLGASVREGLLSAE